MAWLEEPENKTVDIQICPAEPYDAAKSTLMNRNVEKELEFWAQQLKNWGKSRGGITAATLVVSGEQKAIPALVPLTEESKPVKSNLPQKTRRPVLHKVGMTQTNQATKSVTRREAPSGSIRTWFRRGVYQVGKKAVQDSEMDWFANIIPEIKPSAAILILPELRTGMMVPKRVISYQYLVFLKICCSSNYWGRV